jgi:hypothetical protein
VASVRVAPLRTHYLAGLSTPATFCCARRRPIGSSSHRSVCLTNRTVVICSPPNGSRACILTDSVWAPAANTTVLWPTFGSTYTWHPARPTAGAQGTQLVAGEVAGEFLLAGQAGVVITQRGPGAGPAAVRPGSPSAYSRARCGPPASLSTSPALMSSARPCLVGGGVGLPVGEQPEGAAPLFQVLGDDRHHKPPPGPRARGGRADASPPRQRGGGGYRYGADGVPRVILGCGRSGCPR